MKKLIEMFIINLKREDIINFANKNNLKVSEHEIDFVFSFIKSNYKIYLNNPDELNLVKYKNEFSNENYIFLNNLVNTYKKYIK